MYSATSAVAVVRLLMSISCVCLCCASLLYICTIYTIYTISAPPGPGGVRPADDYDLVEMLDVSIPLHYTTTTTCKLLCIACTGCCICR